MLRVIFIAVTALSLAACATGPRQLGMSRQQWQTKSKMEQKQLRADYQAVKKARAANNTVYEGPGIRVVINNGAAMMPPFIKHFAYQPVQFSMRPGQCQQVPLQSRNQQHQVDLGACYNGLTLALDPSPTDVKQAMGSLLLTYNPVWKRGFTYRDLSSQGYVRLQHVNVSIKAIPKVKKHASHPSA